MANTGRYSKHVDLYLTKEMHQFLKLLAERHNTSLNDVVRQAIREHLDRQEDVITSRSRLGRTVMNRLRTMHDQLLGRFTHLSKLLLAAMFILLTEQGQDPAQVAQRVLKLAGQPALDKLVKGKSS